MKFLSTKEWIGFPMLGSGLFLTTWLERPTQLPELFAPIHPHSEWGAGDDCVYKPCKDYCRFTSARCMETLAEKNGHMILKTAVKQRRNKDPRVIGYWVQIVGCWFEKKTSIYQVR